ncbi:cell wall-active antibiotics response protein LiaF [Paenibacillus sp.]|uniref:cell wall-active antibiotics response protein LiaF n=1 Tax=Paenibacillus sp. TaxID=58172 RepID=UPI002D454259|nr:cell wall-active antibiotics response protein LiaF [Paenibacillus sp.]HZG84533.1 cell wall-active antibiotics response protein LiaF [Paenibacillus sp.]
MANGKRNTALLFIGAGLYLAIGHMAGFVAAGALVLALLGFAIVRSSLDSERKDLAGYVLLVVSGLVLLASHWVFALLVAAAAYWFFRKAKRSGEPLPGPDIPLDRSFVKQHIVASVRWGGSEPWTVRSAELAVAIAEVRIDMTNAIFEEPTVDLRLTGLIGDIDVIVPDDVGLAVHADVAIGEIKVAGERGAGIMNRLAWRSPNFETAEHRVQLHVSYAVADVDVKVL